jgi:molybdopterin-guanine dinucleotide biosynthesis protein A
MLAGVDERMPEPVGVVLAGGLGRRIGGAKAVVPLAGRPLISYPIAALRSILTEVRVVAKPGTELPALEGVEVWAEPEEPRHPLVGIVHALRRAAPRAVLVCAADMPLLTGAALAALAAADPRGAPAVVAARRGGLDVVAARRGGLDEVAARRGGLDEVVAAGLEPLLGCYQPQAADLLEPAAVLAQAPVRAAVAAIAPRLLDLGPDAARLLFNVNSGEDLRRAEAILRGELN